MIVFVYIYLFIGVIFSVANMFFALTAKKKRITRSIIVSLALPVIWLPLVIAILCSSRQ